MGTVEMVEPARHPWRFVATIAGCLLLAWFPIARDARVPLLGLVDLGFHELGHLLTSPLPDVLTASMGSITQVAVPLGLAAYFALLRRDAAGGALCLTWAGTSAIDAARYVADAPYERLPLIGGEHDWAFVLGPEHLDALDAAGEIGAAIRIAGILLIAGGTAVAAWGLRRNLPRRERRTLADAPSLPNLGFGGRGGT